MMSRPTCTRLLAQLWLIGTLVATPAAADSVASRFVDGTLSRSPDARDSVARGFDTRQLPLMLAAIVADPPADVDPDRLYDALTRWHFYAGRAFDPRQRGLWSTGDSNQDAPSHATLSTGAALELTELAALARLAYRRGHAFDPLVWWTDHLELRDRLHRRLYDPVHAAYADLDSLGRRRDRPDLSGLIPVALGARHAGEATRRAAWRLWTGAETRVDQRDLSTELAVRERADAFEPWSPDHGMHMVSSAAMAALSLQALDDLDEPILAVYARDAIAARGIIPADSLAIHVGDWQLRLATAELALRPLERSRAALRFLIAIGVFAASDADSIAAIAELPPDAPESNLFTAVASLTDILVGLRALDANAASDRWSRQRGHESELDPGDRAAFDFQWTDLHRWYARALDLITADILQWHLRPDFRSAFEVALDPPVVGQGDDPRLVVRPRGAAAASGLGSTTIELMWTDGRRLLPPESFVLGATGDGTFVADVPALPTTNGLWHLIVEGLPQRPRVPTAVSVVDPVLVELLPVDRRGSTIDWAVQLRSQVRVPFEGRVDLETPLSWTSAPGTSLRYALEPGGTAELEFSVTPDQEVTPGSYPLRWTVWSGGGLVGEFRDLADRPFSWLRIGPLPISDPERPIESPYGLDRRIDLARRVQGVDRMAAWTRLPAGHIDPDGFVRVAQAGRPEAIHYAFTGFVTQSHDAIVELESEGPVRLFVNGREAISMDRWGGRREAEVEFGPGTNFVVLKLVDRDGQGARFRLRARDIDGLPLQAVGNELEHLLENYAYLARAERTEAGVDESHVQRLVPIRFRADGARTVSVVGSFNGWSPSATPMSRSEDGTWQAKIRLRPGRFEYKFAVDGTEWIPDPNNPNAVADGFGGRNSVLMVD